MSAHRLAERAPEASGASPARLPAREWWRILKGAWAEAQRDQVPLLAAGVAFYSFLALFPSMIAAVMLYGLVADPSTVARQAQKISGALPHDAAQMVIDQMRSITEAPAQSLGLGLVVSLMLALWSASGGVGNVVTALNIAYDTEETRGLVRRKLLALGLTLGAIVFVVLALGLVTAAPTVLAALVPNGLLYWALQLLRWVVLVAIVAGVLALLYHIAPDRETPRFQWVSLGAVVGAVIWLAASLVFSLYVNNFASYGKTYGAQAGTVVVLLLWLWITSFIVLLGAEINAESDQHLRESGRG